MNRPGCNLFSVHDAFIGWKANGGGNEVFSRSAQFGSTQPDDFSDLLPLVGWGRDLHCNRPLAPRREKFLQGALEPLYILPYARPPGCGGDTRLFASLLKALANVRRGKHASPRDLCF